MYEWKAKCLRQSHRQFNWKLNNCVIGLLFYGQKKRGMSEHCSPFLAFIYSPIIYFITTFSTFVRSVVLALKVYTPAGYELMFIRL